MVNSPATTLTHCLAVQQLPSGSKSHDPRRTTKGPLVISGKNSFAFPTPNTGRLGTRTLISVSLQDTTMAATPLKSTSLLDTFSPNWIGIKSWPPSLRPGCVCSVVFKKLPNPDPLIVTISSNPADGG